jgi:hypothetical protein
MTAPFFDSTAFSTINGQAEPLLASVSLCHRYRPAHCCYLIAAKVSHSANFSQASAVMSLIIQAFFE